MIRERHRITAYRLADGLILSDSDVTVGEEDAKFEGSPYGWIEGAWGGGEWRIDLDAKEAVPLLEFDPVVGTNRLGNLPPGTLCIFMGQKLVVDDGALELEADDPQVVRVKLIKDLYRPARVEVSCEGAD